MVNFVIVGSHRFPCSLIVLSCYRKSSEEEIQENEEDGMGGVFGVISDKDCVNDLFFGTDYHSHLGTKRGGLAVKNKMGFTRFIHNIENAQFRSKFETDITMMSGNKGIGVISDLDDQPLLIRSHLGSVIDLVPPSSGAANVVHGQTQEGVRVAVLCYVPV